MSPETLELIGVVTGSGVGGVLLTKVFDWFITRASDKKVAVRVEAEAGKFDADAVQAITSAAVALVAPLQEEITKLNLRVDALEAENEEAKTKFGQAIDYIREVLSWIRIHMPNHSPPQPPSQLGI